MSTQEQIAAAIERRLRSSPVENPGYACVPFGEDETPIRVYLFGDVLDELVFAATYSRQPCFAVLTGGFGMEGEGGFIETTGFDGLTYDRIEDGYDVIRETCDDFLMSRNENDDVVVGLFVSEPHCRGVLTDGMARQHMSLFNVPFQPLVVIDPEDQKIGLFTRPPRSKFENCAFWVVRGSDRSEE